MGRSFIRLLLRVFGIALFVFGIIWALQGAGILMWPTDSFMLAQREWALYGALTALVGALLVWLTGRVRAR